MYSFLNGSIIKEDKAKIPLGDRGFLFGDGLFETIAMHNGKMAGFKEHIQRLNRSACKLCFDLQLSKDEIFNTIHDLVKKNGLDGADSYIKVIATRGMQTEGISYQASKEPLVAVIVKKLKPYSPKQYKEGFSLSVSSIKRNKTNPLYSHKMLNYFENIFAKEQALKKGTDEALFLTQENKVLEASTSNLFAVIDGKIHTPPADGSILEGITRARVISLCKDASIEVIESDIYLGDLLRASGLFLTNSIMDVMPVNSIDGHIINGSADCSQTRNIMEMFKSRQ